MTSVDAQSIARGFPFGAKVAFHGLEDWPSLLGYEGGEIMTPKEAAACVRVILSALERLLEGDPPKILDYAHRPEFEPEIHEVGRVVHARLVRHAMRMDGGVYVTCRPDPGGLNVSVVLPGAYLCGSGNAKSPFDVGDAVYEIAFSLMRKWFLPMVYEDTRECRVGAYGSPYTLFDLPAREAGVQDHEISSLRRVMEAAESAEIYIGKNEDDQGQRYSDAVVGAMEVACVAVACRDLGIVHEVFRTEREIYAFLDSLMTLHDFEHYEAVKILDGLASDLAPEMLARLGV